MSFRNNFYNWQWITRRKLQANCKEKDLLATPNNENMDSNGEGVTWLKNLQRLIWNIPYEDSLHNLNFIDVGTGTGITAIYAASNFRFKNVEGFDFEPSLINIANANLRKKTVTSINCKFYLADAAKIKFETQGRSVFYIANSFGTKTMASFINNNLQFIKNNHCYIAICNDHLANYLIGVPELKMIWRTDKYNCSLFGVAR